MKIFNEKTISLIIKETKPDKCGYLLKKGSEYKKPFKRRYFILIGNLLAYYMKNPSPSFDIDPYGIIILEGHFIEIINHSKQNHVFQISFSSGQNKHRKEYILAAESEGDLKDWFHSLVTAGSEYFRLRQNELCRQIKAVHEVLARQSNGESAAIDLNRHNRSNVIISSITNSKSVLLLNDLIDDNPYLRSLLSMNFDEMHRLAEKYFQNVP